MAGKEDDVKVLFAAGRGRAPAEKIVVEGEGFKAEKTVGEVEEFKAEEVAALATRPLPRTFGSKHQREEKPGSGVLRSCTGSHTLAEEKAVHAVAMSSENSNSNSPFSLYEGGKTNGAADAAVQVLEASAVEGQEESDPDDDVKMVEMPMAHIRYILSQKKENHVVPPIEDYDIYTEEAMRSTVFTKENIDVKRQAFRNLHASLQAKHDDFFQYQAWVGDEFEKNGRVMVPEPCTKEELQEQINDVWARCKEEYARDHPDDYSDTETEGEA